MENRHMCEKMSEVPVFSSERLLCTLQILQKEFSLLWPKKSFILFLLNVDDNCYKTAAEQN